MSTESDENVGQNGSAIETAAANSSRPRKRTFSRLSAMVVTSCLLVIVYVCCNKNKTVVVPGTVSPTGIPQEVSPTITKDITTATVNTKSRSLLFGADEDEEALLEKIRRKVQPVPLLFAPPSSVVDGNSDGDGTPATKNPVLQNHQVLHLHHMKTGGTSIDHLLRCAIDRLVNEVQWDVPYYSIHECSRKRFASCLSDDANECRKYMGDASIMSYCAALKYLGTFGWWDETKNANQNIKAFTVLRNPVDRVWSMFRFQTKSCYSCTPLLEIYEKIESNDTSHFDPLCLAQLQNHEVANLLSSTDWPVSPESLDIDDSIQQAMIAEAVENMKTFFTVIGLTEELPATARTLGRVFPWLNTTLDDPKVFGEHRIQTACVLTHDNQSPSNNRCIPGATRADPATHWELPNHPDEETIAAIRKYNQMDIALYEAAVQYFELQQRAIESGEEEG
jgi:hypothetical protein